MRQLESVARTLRCESLPAVANRFVVACLIGFVLLNAGVYGQQSPIQGLPAVFKAENGNEFSLALKEQIQPEEDAVGLIADTKENKLYLLVSADREEPIELLFELKGTPAEAWRISTMDAPDNPVKEVTVKLEPDEDLSNPEKLAFPFRGKLKNLPEKLSDDHGNELHISESGSGNAVLSHNTPNGADQGAIMVDLPEPSSKEEPADAEPESPFPITFNLILEGHPATDWEVEEESPKNISFTIEENRMIQPSQVSMHFIKKEQGSGGQPNPSGEDEESYLASTLSESPLPEHLEVELILLPVDIAVDANRDGVIKFVGNATADAEYDKTEEAKPFRFWVNDDDDRDNKDHPGSNVKDCDNNHIESLRDLEDFTRLHLHIGGLQDAIASGELSVGLKWRNTSGASPSIKVYQAAETNGGDEYLKSVIAGGNQSTGATATALGTVNNGGSFKFPTSFWAENMLLGRHRLSGEHPDRHLIFEGAAEGKGELVLTFWKGTKKLGEGSGVWIQLMNVRKMYQSSEDDRFEESGDEENTSITFVHGWNMSPAGSRNYAETMFKRLWHRGFKGRFAYFRWNTGWSDAFDNVPRYGEALEAYFAKYNSSEYHAWTVAGPALKQFMQQIPSTNKNIAAHSMGNIVVGAAMRSGMTVNNYAMMQAAVPSACYDERELLKQADPVTHKTKFLGPLKSVTVWTTLTPDDDPDPQTLALAYRGLLGDIGRNTNIINFYLPNDNATAYAWEINNEVTKPPGGFMTGHFRYVRTNPSGQKLYKDYGGGLHVYDWFCRYDSVSFACRTWAKAVGAERRTRGSVQSDVDLGNSAFELPGVQSSGFGDRHSGQFEANFQNLKPFYDALLDELRLSRN